MKIHIISSSPYISQVECSLQNFMNSFSKITLIIHSETVALMCNISRQFEYTEEQDFNLFICNVCDNYELSKFDKLNMILANERLTIKVKIQFSPRI